MKTLKELKEKEGIIGFSRMRKAELLDLWEESQPKEPLKVHYGRELQKKKKKKVMDISNEKVTILKSAVKNVLPENVSNVIEDSTEKAIDFVKKAWDKKDKLKERARKRLLELNKKIGKLLEKLEFEITEKAGLAGKKITIWGKEGYSADGFLENNR